MWNASLRACLLAFLLAAGLLLPSWPIARADNGAADAPHRKAVPLSLQDIDVISGATVTSQAVVDAINAAWAAHEAAPEEEKALPFAGEAMGFAGPVWVKVLFENGEIAALTIGDDRFQESEGRGARALEPAFRAQFTGEQPEALEKSVPPACVRVSVQGRLYAILWLGEERSVEIDQGDGVKNVVHLLPDGFYMECSTCQNQLCVQQGTVTVDNYPRRMLGPYVLCLPNQVELELIVLDSAPSDMPDA